VNVTIRETNFISIKWFTDRNRIISTSKCERIRRSVVDRWA